jgi:hypothetical protein
MVRSDDMSDVLDEHPTELPPSEAGGTSSTAAGGSAPTLLTPVSIETVAAADLGPSLTAPPAAAAEGVTAATWRSGQVTALWSIDEVRNAWIQVSGVGWRKLFNGRDGAYTALLILASQARQTGRTIQFREEADGMVYEIYLW